MRIDILINGLTIGSLYALVALSLNVMYRPTNVFNFAQGELVSIGALLFATFATIKGLAWPAALVVALLAMGFVGWLTERLAVAPIVKKSTQSAAWIISTLSISLIASNLVSKIWGADPARVDPPWPLSTKSLGGWAGGASSYQIALILLTLLVLLAVERFYSTRNGKAILAIAEDREAALLRAISPDRLSQVSYACGGALAALAGVLAGPILFASPELGPLLLLNGFAVAALGGIGNNRGALLAGYIVGVAEAVASAFLSPGYQRASIFVLLLAILLVWPQGLLSSGATRRV